MFGGPGERFSREDQAFILEATHHPMYSSSGIAVVVAREENRVVSRNR